MPQYLDSENIFPKRLGVMNGNTLVIEYYELTRDKFKKHAISYNPQEEVKSIIDEIYKSAKHVPFIKKIDPKHLKAVLEGHSIGVKREQAK
jgi:hypothetical protein